MKIKNFLKVSGVVSVLVLGCAAVLLYERSDSYEEEVHDKARPDKQSGLSEPPYFAHHVIYDVRNGKYYQTACLTVAEKCDLFGFEHVCRYKTNAEEYAEING